MGKRTFLGPSILVGATAALAAFAIGSIWLLSSGRVRRHESRRFRLTIDETLPISVVAPGPEEFSDQVASTTPIRLPQAPREAEPERLRRAG